MLTKLEKRVLRQIQEPMKVCQRPFAAMGRRVGCTPGEVIETICGLKAGGYIRRFSAAVHYAALGRTATLVAASVPQRKLNKVIAAVDSLGGVSHHYLREHEFNLWFTLQDKSLGDIEYTLRRLNQRTGVRFYSLPAVRVFKLDARFSPQGPTPGDFKVKEFSAAKSVCGRITLKRTEKKVLRFLQQEFPIVNRPFEVLSRQSGIDDFLEITKTLAAKGVIRRIAAVAAYRRLGYKTNVMACFAVPQDTIESAGKWLSKRPAVSHCYQRRTFEGWPYNLFAMVHARKISDVKRFAKEAARRFGITDWQMLPTEKEIKKQPVMV